MERKLIAEKRTSVEVLSLQRSTFQGDTRRHVQSHYTLFGKRVLFKFKMLDQFKALEPAVFILS